MKIKIPLTAKSYGKNGERGSYSMYSNAMFILDRSW